MPDLPWEPQNPYILYGIARSVAAGITVTAINKRTGESQTVQTETGGEYLVDCANFASGYNDLDTVELRVAGNVQITSVNSGVFPPGRQVDIIPQAFGALEHRRRRLG